MGDPYHTVKGPRCEKKWLAFYAKEAHDAQTLKKCGACKVDYLVMCFVLMGGHARLSH
jgi:hypothetical protein